ncbi:unnamed protein product [Allacma fusca]|uniref:Uncharacterized protein n=1 Tax=Allacma fusca TaxID=39272 RepID=A0A8J2JC23_9HEXA|nr:unnamed protein product [Allacma fusca]
MKEEPELSSFQSQNFNFKSFNAIFSCFGSSGHNVYFHQSWTMFHSITVIPGTISPKMLELSSSKILALNFLNAAD